MRFAKPSGLKKILIATLLIAILAGASYFAYTKYIRKTTTPSKQMSVSYKTITDTQSTAANKFLVKKDYVSAVNGYISASAAATSQGDNKKAEDILITAAKQIPYDKTPYYLYESLAYAAMQQKDISTEKTAFGKAYALAILPNSGASQAVIDIYKKELQKLGIKV